MEVSRKSDEKFEEIQKNVNDLVEKIKEMNIKITNGVSTRDPSPTKTESDILNPFHTFMARGVKEETTPPMGIKLPPFDGKSSWSIYLRQFEAIATANHWTKEQQAVSLTTALQGDAADILRSIPKGQERCYEILLHRLEKRYGDAQCQYVCKAELKSRIQRASETLQEFASNVARLVRLAYPERDDDLWEEMATDAFVGGLREKELRFYLRLARPKQLDEALAIALEHEAAREELRSHQLHSMEEVKEISQRVGCDIPKKRQTTCRNCGEVGHLRRNCQKPLQQYTSRLQQYKNRSIVTVNITSAGEMHNLYVNGRVDDKHTPFLVDTGATRTIARPEIVRELSRLSPASVQLRTATGEVIKTYGQVTAPVCIGQTTVEHKIIIAEISDQFILGMDLLKKIGAVLDVKNGVLKVDGQEFPFHEHKEDVLRLVTTCDTMIPGHSEKIIMTRLDGYCREGSLRMIEAVSNTEFLTAKALVRVRDAIPVRVMNVKETPIKLSSKTLVGQCVPVESICYMTTTDKTSKSKCPQELLDMVVNTCQDLDNAQANRVRAMLVEFQDVFAIDDKDRGQTSIVTHKINTGDAQPIRQSPRRLPFAKRDEAEGIIKDMDKQGVIEPSNSPWTSPVVLVKKKDGSTRFCIDYRQLNAVTKKDSYPLPRIDDTLDTLSGSRWFSTLDLKSGYWQVGMEPSDREKTAFSIGSGLWQFKVMPFGLCNAPATFERLMEAVLRGLTWQTCLVYLDDVIVVGKSFEEHAKNLKEVFQRLRAANLKLSLKKCHMFRREVRYLGHIVSGNGVTADPEKIEAIREWPIPKDKHEIRSFLGLCTYYRRFVQGFATIAKPLTRLTEEGKEYKWTEECQQAFEHLQKALITAPILSYPRQEGKFILDTDASNTAIGAVLSQIQDGQEKVIAYFSKVLSKPERNYCVTRRELLGVVKACEHFHKYLYGRKFLLRTDHAALKWLLQFRNPEGQMARWLERLQEYDFDIEHRAGRIHSNADALSRRPCSTNCSHCSKLEERLCYVRRTAVVNDQWQPQQLQDAQENDPCLKLVLNWKRQDERPTWRDISACSPEVKCYWSQWNCLILKDDILYRNFENDDGTESTLQLVVPKSKVSEILRQLHDGASGGHFGVNKTLQKVRERFYWVNCKNDVRRWCRQCELCATGNGPVGRKRAPMKQYNVGAPMERVAIDIAGPFPATDAGNRYILVAMDYFTKWTEAYALPNQEASSVADVLVKEFFSRFGVPLEIHSDQGRNFESALFQNVCRLIGANKTRTTPLHPQSDGMVERMNRTMGKHLSKVVSEHQRDWDQYIPLFLMAYRSAVNETTGQTPACLMLGREVRLPCDLEFGCKPSEENVAGEDYVDQLKLKMHNIHDLARQHIHIASDRMKSHYDSRSSNVSFQVGDSVWLYNPQRRRGLSPKLQRHWEGPYEIKKRINDVLYRIRKLPRGKPKVVHVNRLAPYAGSNENEEARVVQVHQNVDSYQPNFNEFMSNYADRKKIRCGVTTEVQQDIFTVPSDVSIANCVAEDLNMTRGISSVFSKKFGRLDELKDQQPKVGKVLRLEDGHRSLLYMVTKRYSNESPSYEDIWRTLTNLKVIVCNYDIKHLALPKIGHGLENLDWKIIRSMVEVIFQETGVSITICCFNPRGQCSSKTVDCHFFLQGFCRAGNSCRFRHQEPMLKISDRDDQN